MGDIVKVPFHGDELLTTEYQGKPGVLLKPTFDSIGIDAKTQIDKLEGKSWASTGLVPVQVGDQRRNMVVSDVRTFLMLLATIDERRVSDAARPKLIAYQSEVADAIEAYWTQGGAINPRASENQLDSIARRAKAQAEVIATLRGVIDPKHLEAKARIVLARSMGEAPELDPLSTPLYAQDFLRDKGMKRADITSAASTFGKRVKAAYVMEHGDEPKFHNQNLPNGQVRQVRAYTEADRPLMQQVWDRFYASASGGAA